MDKIRDVYKQEKELLRLAMQQSFLKEEEEPIYNRVLEGMEHGVVLDIGCNDGTRTVDRFGTDRVSKVIGVEYHRELADRANSNHGGGKFHFYQADAESSGFEDSLENIMEIFGIEGFDIINISFVLMHLKDPGKLLSRMKNFLKPGGTLISVETDDRFSRMLPDKEGRMKQFLEFCRKDMLSGRRRLGGDVPDMLELCGYQDVLVHSRCISASASEKNRKEQMFEIAFSWLLEDFEQMCRIYPENQEYARIKTEIAENYEKFRIDFTEKSTEVSCGLVMVTGVR